MIGFSVSDVTMVSLTEVDVGLVLPYLKYSDYILRVLGGFPTTITDPVKYLDFRVRMALGRRTANGISGEFGRLHSVYQNEINTAAMVSAPYQVAIAVSRNMQESLANIIDLPTKVGTFETRLPYRYDPPNPVGRDGFLFFMESLCHPRPVRRQGWGWDHRISAPEYGIYDMASLNQAHINAEWNRYFPRLFVVRRDLTPVRGDIGKVLAAFAGDRRTTEGYVRKVLGVKA